MTLISLWIFFFMHKEDKVYYIMLIMKCTGNTYGRERIDRREKWAEPWIASLGHKTSLIKFIHRFPVSCLVCIGIIIREIVYVCVSGREREASTYTLWALNQLIISTMCLNICAIWCVVSLQIISCCGHVCICEAWKTKMVKDWAKRKPIYAKLHWSSLSTLSLNSEWIQKLICNYLFLFLP